MLAPGDSTTFLIQMVSQHAHGHGIVVPLSVNFSATFMSESAQQRGQHPWPVYEISG